MSGTTVDGTFNDLFARALRDQGVDVMFAVMGDANMYIADSFQRSAGGSLVSSANESGAVLMAAGYAAVQDRVGVATVTHGAIANTVSALFDAARGGYPVLVIAGDTSRHDGFHLQNIPQREVVAPTGAEYRLVRAPETAAEDLAAALRSAVAHQRPVVLEIPIDFQQAKCTMTTPAERFFGTGITHPSRESLEEAASTIIGSIRPLVIAGRGARDAEESLTKLAKRIGAPVATTLRGKGLFHDDPFNVGICGTLSNPVAGEAIARADCLIVVGASWNQLTTYKGEIGAGKRVIQIDSDPGAIGRYFAGEVGIVGDAETTAIMLTELLDTVDATPSGFRSTQLAQQVREFRRSDRADSDTTADLTLSGVLHRINEIVDLDRTLTIDGGRFSHEALRILEVPHPSRYAHCLSVGHIGLSVGYGIGAAFGRPDVPALVVAGDGSFMLGGLAEFNTAVRYGRNLIVVVLNDSAYGAEYYRFVDQSIDPTLTTFAWPSFAELARALGGRGIRIATWSDFDDLDLTEGSGPTLIEVILDPATIPAPGMH